MAKSDFWDSSETGNWNVASDFVKLKIMKLLYECDQYEIVATFGEAEMYDELLLKDESIKSSLRLKAIIRLIKTLQMIINNTKFAVKKGDKESMKKYLEDLKEFKKTVPHLKKKSYNQQHHKTTITIDEEKFDKILDAIIILKANMLEQLNKADLIFSYTEEFDPAKAKEEMKKRLTEIG